jgi:hypothetical protein
MCNCKWDFTNNFKIIIKDGKVYIRCLKCNEERAVSLKYDKGENVDIEYGNTSVIKTI